MAAFTTSRPFSLLQPPSSSSIDHKYSDLSPLRRPKSPRAESAGASSPRPFSLYQPSQAEDLFSSFSSKRRSIIKTPSLANLNMGFGFRSEKSKEKEKGKQVEREKEKLQRPRTASETSARSFEPFPVQQLQRADSSQRASPSTSTGPRPSSSQGRFNLQVPSMRGLKKKRSLASLLPAANESSLSPNAQAPSSSRSKSTNDSESSPTPLHDPDVDIPSKARPWSKRYNMKVPLHKFDAPYMQAYDPILLDNDRYSDLLLHRLNPIDGPSFHSYDQTPPSSVLDLGCGAGHWMLAAAGTWSQTKFTGFDLVDVLSEDAHTHDNIGLINGNFLQLPWPFEHGSFDLIRMANLSLCVPYDQWDTILLEAQRVLRINGRIELIDDEIFFPYAPQPPRSRATSTPGSASPPGESQPFRHHKGVSFLDSDTDDDTLEGNGSDDDYGTASSESTLISERDFPFSLNGNGISPAHGRSTPHYRKRSSLGKSTDSQDIVVRTPTSPDHIVTPTSTTTIIPSPDRVDSPQWSSGVAASKDVETVFENMLRFKYGIHLRASEVLPEALKGVFGNVQEVGSFQLKLAPPEAAKSVQTPTEATGEKDEKPTETRVGRKLNDITKSWEDRWQSRKANKISNHELPPLDTLFLPADSIPEYLPAKAAGRLGILEDSPPADHRVPDKLSAKAASRLGISVLGDLRHSDEMVLSPVVENAGESESESEAESITSTPTPGNFMPAVAGRRSDDGISAKAANRLGISYSALTQAAKVSRRPLSSSSTLVSNWAGSIAQSSGLIVQPTSEFIPFTPGELDMHACKNIHMLIGCKPALLDFNAAYVDKNGQPLQSQEEFDQGLWEYECFRRRRFNWPSDFPDWDVDSPELDDTASATPSLKSTSTPKTPTSHYRKSSDRFDPEVSLSSSPSLDALRHGLVPTLNDLTHVRTIRVYHAVKTSEKPITKATLFRPLPPIPPPSPLISMHAPRIQVSNTL